MASLKYLIVALVILQKVQRPIYDQTTWICMFDAWNNLDLHMTKQLN